MNEKKFVHRKSHKPAWWMSRKWSETYHATIDGKTALCGVQGGLTGSNPFPEVLDASTDHRACAHCRRAVRLDTPTEGGSGNPDRYVWKTIGGRGVEMSIFGANGQLVKKELLALDEAFARWTLLGEMMMLSSGTLDVSVRAGGLQQVGANAVLLDAAKNPGEPPKVMAVEKNYGRPKSGIETWAGRPGVPMPPPVQSRGAEHIRTDEELPGGPPSFYTECTCGAFESNTEISSSATHKPGCRWTEGDLFVHHEALIDGEKVGVEVFSSAPIEVVATFTGSKEVGGKKFNTFSFKPVSGEWPKKEGGSDA